MAVPTKIIELNSGVIRAAFSKAGKDRATVFIDSKLALLDEQMAKMGVALAPPHTAKRYWVLTFKNTAHSVDPVTKNYIWTAANSGFNGRGFDKYDDAEDFYAGRAIADSGHASVKRGARNIGKDED